MKYSIYIQAFLYTFAGIWHFVKPQFYSKILPPTLSENPKLWIYISGIAEIICGLGLLFQTTRNLSSWGIIIMLILFFWVHIYMLTPNFSGDLPNWALWVRLLLQFILIYWAYSIIQK